MSRRVIDVNELLSYAHRTGQDVKTVLHLAAGILEPGTAEVRLRGGKRGFVVPAEVTADGSQCILTFSAPWARLRGGVWQVSVRREPADPLVRVQARLLVRPGLPVALLPGPPPRTGAAESASRQRRPAPRGGSRDVRGAVSSALGRARSVAGRASRARRTAVRPPGPGRGSGDSRPRRAVSDRGPSSAPPQSPMPPSPRIDRSGRLLGATRLTTNGRRQRKVVIVTHPSCVAEVPRWLDQLRGEQVTVLCLGDGDLLVEGLSPAAAGVTSVGTVGQMVRAIEPLGALDLIVCAVPSSGLPEGVPDHYALFERLFLHLSRGGSFVLDRTVAAEEKSIAPPPRWQHLLAPLAGETAPVRSAGDVEIAQSIGGLVVARDRLVVTSKRRHFVKTREDQVETLLRAREPAVRLSVPVRLSAGSYQSRATQHSYGPRIGEAFPDLIEYPELAVRHYPGRISSGGGMLLFSGDTILPESFRWPYHSVLVNPRMVTVNHVARIPARHIARRKEVLDGTYYHLDCAYSGNFGHLMTEVLSRLWGWDQAKRANPELKAFCTVRRNDRGRGRLERALFTAYGIGEGDIVCAEKPVILTDVIGASPMWQNAEPYYAHPDIRETWARLTAGMLDGERPATHERIFVSRGEDLAARRGCRNQKQVEQFFADRGFHVFFPERLSLSEQVALFAGARVVAGFGGSGMFNMMHSERLEATIVLSHHGYVARNEHLFASLLGGELHYFWSQSDVTPPERGRTTESFRSSWAFDFDTWGAELDRVLRSA